MLGPVLLKQRDRIHSPRNTHEGIVSTRGTHGEDGVRSGRRDERDHVCDETKRRRLIPKKNVLRQKEANRSIGSGKKPVGGGTYGTS